MKKSNLFLSFWRKGGLKVLLCMKFTLLFLLLGVMQSYGKAYSQNAKLTIHLKNTRLNKALTKIEKSSDYRFLYNDKEVRATQKIDLSVTDMPFNEVLNHLLAHTGLSYKILENKLVIIAPEPSTVQVKEITGTVTDSTGQPLIGVTIKVKGTSLGTVTNAQGQFSLNVPDSGAVLEISYIGYLTKDVQVNGQTDLKIVLSSSATSLDQVVVIGYGTQRKRDLTGSIAVISGDEVAKMPNSNPVSSLQGKVAGMTIVNTGQAGSSPTVRIRGVNSTNNADPLYVVDGILQTNIDYLNPADISSIEVLKDPSSIAIYGLQGGNGVIIITTKHAKQGETRVSFQSNISWQRVQNPIKVADAAGFQKLYNAQLANLGADPFDYTNYTANTDWQNIVLRTALQSNNSLSISNSTDKSSTYVNIGYSNQQGVVKYDKYQKYTARLREEINVGDHIKVGGEVIGYHYKQNPPADIGNLTNKAIWATPIAPIKANDRLYYAMPPFQSAQVDNPAAIIAENKDHHFNQGYRTVGNVYAEINFLKHFTWKSTFYTELSFNQTSGYTPLPFHYINLGEPNAANPSQTDTSYAVNPHTSVSQSHTLFKTFQQDHTLTYTQDFASGHHITAFVGFSTLYHYNESINGNRTDTSLNIPNNPNFWYLNIAQQSNPGNFGGGAAEDASMSFMGRVNYTYKSKYLLNLTFRRDGTSKFSPDKQWGNFGSVGAGWVMTDEPFMQDIPWLDFLKLKASWGTVGNGLSIGNYLSYPALNNANVGIFGQNIYPSVQAAYIPDPNLHWETVEGKDAGFEMRMFDHRLSLDVDFYDRKTHDILTTITLPGAAGETNFFTNLGTIDNKGIEVSAGWKDKLGPNFSYAINGNFSVNKNKVVSIGDNINFNIKGNGGANETRTGQSIGYFYGYVQTGIYQTTAQLDKMPHMSSSAPGDISFKDVNSDGKISPDDRTYLGSPFPKYNFGGSISLNYKNFDLGINLQGVTGNKIYVQRRTATFAILNYEVNRLDAWTGAGTTNVEPVMDNTRSDNFLFSSYWLEPGDYLRLRTVQLGYTFNTHILQGKGMQTLRLYISGQNIATFTNATGFSPEVPINDPTSAGADNGVYPVPAIYSFGVNLSF